MSLLTHFNIYVWKIDKQKGEKPSQIKKEVIIQNSAAELLLTVDVWWCTSPSSLSPPARAANRHYEGLSSIEVLMDAILMLSIRTNYNNLQHIHREMGTIQKLVIEIVWWQLKHLWLAAASKLPERGIYINKGFPLAEGACVSSRVCGSLF